MENNSVSIFTVPVQLAASRYGLYHCATQHYRGGMLSGLKKLGKLNWVEGILLHDKSTKLGHLHCTQTTENVASRCILRV